MKSFLKTLDKNGNNRSAFLVLPSLLALGFSGCVSDGVDFAQTDSTCAEPREIFDPNVHPVPSIAPIHLPDGSYQRMESEVYVSRENSAGVVSSRIHYKQVPYGMHYPLAPSEFSHSEVSLKCRQTGAGFIATTESITLPDAFIVKDSGRTFDIQDREFSIRFSSFSDSSLAMQDGGRSPQVTVSDFAQLLSRFWIGGAHFSKVSEGVYAFYGIRADGYGSVIYARAMFKLIR